MERASEMRHLVDRSGKVWSMRRKFKFQARDRLTVEDDLYHMVLNTLVSHFLFVLGCISRQIFDLRLGMILGVPF